jgi:hypothetical protein
LFEVIGPEVRSPFAQHTLQTMFMLLESLAAEIGGEESLAGDGERIDGLLARVKAAVDGGETQDEELVAVAKALPADGSTRLVLLERAIVALEAGSGQQSASLEAARKEIYGYLREVAGRGWSFWDMLSFRQPSS